MIKRREIDDDALDDMEIFSSEDDSSSMKDIQGSGNVSIHIIWYLFTHVLTNPFVLLQFQLG